jgi:hypothetical protein
MSGEPDQGLKLLAEVADQLRLLAQEVNYAAVDGDAQAVTTAAERLLPLHVEFARQYRGWLARRIAPPRVTDSMSV